MSDRYLRAYFHTFEPTGDDKVDAILEAVAMAGKAFHNTMYWDEADEYGPAGYWSLIQKRANEAASAAADERSAAVPPKLIDVVRAHVVDLRTVAVMLRSEFEGLEDAAAEFDKACDELESALAASPEVCASGSGERETADGWRPIESAPKCRMLALVDGQVRIVAWGKASHVPWQGYCLADQGVEDFDLCEPTHWMPLPSPPSSEVAAGVPEGAQGQQQGRQGEKAEGDKCRSGG